MKTTTPTGEWFLRGETYYNILGDSPAQVLENAVKIMRLPHDLTREAVTAALLARESVMPTAIGLGFAVPHPRESIVSDEADAMVAVCYLEHAIDWAAPDGLPVETIFIVLSANHAGHLSILSAIASVVQEEGFREFISGKPTRTELVEYLENH
ncbi:MAG: PTS sugar transporter subunit IIA [Spirochaetaceae bacterium]|nr:PTS sugar transporter subunit IIA [Spirochaetaceae bacterium]